MQHNKKMENIKENLREKKECRELIYLSLEFQKQGKQKYRDNI